MHKARNLLLIPTLPKRGATLQAKTTWLAVSAALMATWPTTHAQALTYQDVQLQEALQQAPIVMCARYLGRDARKHHAHRFTVERSLRGLSLRRGQHIHVFSLEAATMHRARQAHRATGVWRQPRIRRLDSRHRAKLVRGRSYCLLLRAGPAKAYTLAVAQGHMAAPCSALRRALAKPRQRSSSSMR
ncbi:MAG: hypothetical protein ACPGUV_07035 [Polyangiales bacterium]